MDSNPRFRVLGFRILGLGFRASLPRCEQAVVKPRKPPIRSGFLFGFGFSLGFRLGG